MKKSDSKYVKYDDSNDEDSDEEPRERMEKPIVEKTRCAGTAIAPPPSLLEDCTIMSGNENEREIRMHIDNDDMDDNWDAMAIAATQARYGT